MLNSSLFSCTPSVACTQLKKVEEETSLAVCNRTSITTITMSPSTLRSSTEPSRLTQTQPETDLQNLALHLDGSSLEPTSGSFKKPHRVWIPKRSWSAIMPNSRSFEVLLDKTKATFTGKSNSQHFQSENLERKQRMSSAKILPKSSSHGSVASCMSEKKLLRGASLFLPGSSTPRLEALRCHGPFSHCFPSRKTNPDGDDEDREKSPNFASSVCSAVLAADSKSHWEKTNTATNDMSLKSRLARVNSMKGKTYSLHTGFALARKDALEIAGVLRSSVGQLCRSEKQEVGEADSFSELLSMQAKVLNSTCSRMTVEYGTPEELLLTLTHSFHTLCCLTQACMSLVEGLSIEHQRRAVVAKVDEVIMHYVCLLKAAEAASGSAPTDQSVNALLRHSATMSAVINALIHSQETLLNK